MAEPTIAAGYPKALLEFAAARGADRAAVLAEAGITAEELADADNRIAMTRYAALLAAAIAACREPALALQFGEAVRMQDISIVGLICEAAPTTAEVGRQLNRYGRLVVDEDRGGDATLVRSTRDAQGLWMEAASDLYARYPFMIEAEFARLVWNTRIAFADDPVFQTMQFPRAVHFMHPEPPYRAEYERIFGAPLTFGSHRNAMLLDDRFPALRQKPTNAYVFGILIERADALLKELETATSIRARVESLLLPILHTGDASMDVIAKKIGLSRRTLQRRLSAEGVGFEKVLDELRHKMAVQYLGGRKVSINEAAYLTGFSEPAAFSRAFKRWTGTSPRAARGGIANAGR